MFKKMSMLWLGSLALAQTGVVADDEDVFKEALKYTVKVETRVDTPFFEDQKGSFNAAGFLVDAERRWIMTNAHVVARSPSHVSVAFHEEETFHPVEKFYVDPYLDLAILKLPGETKLDRPVASLECGSPPSIGHPVGALGHPWGLFFTGTRGVISGITDKVGAEFLQTDAPINEGNSGGPLISMKSTKVVGINTSSVSKIGDQNTNFATPIKYACRVLQLLQTGQNPSPPQMPVLFLIDLDDTNQLIVASTNLGTDLIGLQQGDKIDSVVGETGPIQNESHLIHALRGHLDKFTLQVIRDGKSLELSGKLNPIPRITDRVGISVSGVLIAPWGIRDWYELKLPRFMVHYVEAGSVGDNEKIQVGDSLVALDGKEINDLKELFAHLQAAQTKASGVRMKLKRFSSLDDRLYDYLERTLTVEELKYIGASP